MQTITKTILLALITIVSWSCVDNALDETPNDENFPLQLLLDTDEGGDLPDAEDYKLEIKFADHIGSLPRQPITISYQIDDLEGDMPESVMIDKIVHEYEDDDCVFERELEFTVEGDGTRGTITLSVDPDLGTVPEAFEVVFTLPGKDDTGGSFSFHISDIRTEENIILGAPLSFGYEVLDNDLAGEWKFTIADEEQFEQFKSIFGPVNSDLDAVAFSDITGDVTAEFAYGEMKFILELAEEVEEVVCDDGETTAETNHLEIEIAADYDAEDGVLAMEGSYFILGDDGEVEDELDFQAEAAYEILEGQLHLTFLHVIDEDHYEEGDELFRSEEGIRFILEKD